MVQQKEIVLKSLLHPHLLTRRLRDDIERTAVQGDLGAFEVALVARMTDVVFDNPNLIMGSVSHRIQI